MRLSTLAVLALTALSGCGGGPPPETATRNETFYKFENLPVGSSSSEFERPYPKLNKAAQGGLPEYVGVSVLGGTVHLSRPVGWRIRRASLTAEKRYIEYVSPSEYLVSIYERTDSPADPWKDILERYEETAKAKGAQIEGARMPVATWNVQGREYIVRRSVKGQRAPYTHLSREVLLRSEHRVDLLEIVHQGESIAPVGGELLRVMETLEVL